MQELGPEDYDIVNAVKEGGIPDDTITIIIKCGGKIFSRGVNLEDTHEKTAKMTTVLLQQVVDTVDTLGLKSGGPTPSEAA